MLTGASRRTHSEMIDFSDEDDLSNVNVKSLVSVAPQSGMPSAN